MNQYLMPMIADLLNLEVRMSVASEATAIGIASRAVVSAAGISMKELLANWKAETSYLPKLNVSEREQRLAR